MLHQAQHVPQERENLEINGSVFPLIDFKMVGYYDNTVFLRHALLRLSEKQFLQLNDILDNDVLELIRKPIGSRFNPELKQGFRISSYKSEE